jgi:hypothetical protein
VSDKGSALDTASIPAIKATEEKIQLALDAAWRRSNAYDFQANMLKHRYTRIRLFVIVASFFTTLIAVFEAMTMNNSLSLVWRFFLVTLPLLSAAVLTFAARFEGGNAWVGFRLASETIKRNIYMLRVKQSYTDITLKDLNQLRKVMEMSTSHLEEMGVTTPVFLDSVDSDLDPDVLERAKPNYVDVPQKDDGYNPLSVRQYIEWRVLPQSEWYRRRATTDYRRIRFFRGTILLVGVLGPMLAAFGYGIWVAVTVASVNGLLAYVGLNQYEQNYPVYNKTAQQLENLVNKFRFNEDIFKQEDLLNWISQVEAAFSGEREMWQLTVLRGQVATEEALTQLVNTRTDVLQRIQPSTAIAGIDDNEPTAQTPVG